MKSIVIVALAGAALAACGGGSEPASPPSLADMMAAAGCRGDIRTGEMFAVEATDCTINGRQGQANAATFATTGNRDQWVTMVRGAGYPVRTGDLWAVSGTDQATVDTFADAVA